MSAAYARGPRFLEPMIQRMFTRSGPRQSGADEPLGATLQRREIRKTFIITRTPPPSERVCGASKRDSRL